MTVSRPVWWVSPLLYGAVLFAGLYAGDTRPALFLGALGALFTVELCQRRLPETKLVAGVVLAAQTTLFVAVSYADGSGLSRVLFVLVPFTAYFAFGRWISIALGLLIMVYQLSSSDFTPDMEQLADLLMFGIGLVLVITMAAVAVEERKGRKRIADLSAAAERHRLARDIHDELGHHLTAIIVQLEKAATFRDRDPQAADRALHDAAHSARQALTGVRESVRVEAAPFQLPPALRQLAGSDVVIELAGDASAYQETVLVVLYRAAQEGITNARRHGGAQRIEVKVDLGAERAQLVIADAGQGFDASREGFGLRGMRERVQAAGGQLTVESGPSAGTRLTVTVPRQATGSACASRQKCGHA